MKISDISVSSWSAGKIMVTLDSGDHLHIQLTEEETERFRMLATEIFQSRQKAIAREVETAAPALLADFSEAAPVPVDLDDVPF